jgi:hypothetical protein
VLRIIIGFCKVSPQNNKLEIPMKALLGLIALSAPLTLAAQPATSYLEAYCQRAESLPFTEQLTAAACTGQMAPQTTREAARSLRLLAEATNEVRYEKWSQLSDSENQALETLAWDTLNESSRMITRLVDEELKKVGF